MRLSNPLHSSDWHQLPQKQNFINYYYCLQCSWVGYYSNNFSLAICVWVKSTACTKDIGNFGVWKLGLVYLTKVILLKWKDITKLDVWQPSLIGLICTLCYYFFSTLTSYLCVAKLQKLKNVCLRHSEPVPTSAPSTGCLFLLTCGWTSTELILGFTLVTNSVGKLGPIYW